MMATELLSTGNDSFDHSNKQGPASLGSGMMTNDDVSLSAASMMSHGTATYTAGEGICIGDREYSFCKENFKNNSKAISSITTTVSEQERGITAAAKATTGSSGVLKRDFEFSFPTKRGMGMSVDVGVGGKGSGMSITGIPTATSTIIGSSDSTSNNSNADSSRQMRRRITTVDDSSTDDSSTAASLSTHATHSLASSARTNRPSEKAAYDAEMGAMIKRGRYAASPSSDLEDYQSDADGNGDSDSGQDAQDLSFLDSSQIPQTVLKHKKSLLSQQQGQTLTPFGWPTSNLFPQSRAALCSLEMGGMGTGNATPPIIIGGNESSSSIGLETRTQREVEQGDRKRHKQVVGIRIAGRKAGRPGESRERRGGGGYDSNEDEDDVRDSSLNIELAGPASDGYVAFLQEQYDSLITSKTLLSDQLNSQKQLNVKLIVAMKKKDEEATILKKGFFKANMKIKDLTIRLLQAQNGMLAFTKAEAVHRENQQLLSENSELRTVVDEAGDLINSLEQTITGLRESLQRGYDNSYGFGRPGGEGGYGPPDVY